MRRFAVAALVVAVAILGLPAGAAAEPTCTDTWTGGAGDGLWQSAGNWSTASVPSSSDVACIGSGASVQVTTGSDHAGVLEDGGSLTISGGSLELTSSSTSSSVASLSVQGGALTGAGSLHVSGSLSWTKAATMSGTGSTVLQSGASGAIELAAGEKATLEGRALVNDGTLTFAGGTIAMSAGARIENAGTFRANSETASYGSQIEVPSGSGGAAPAFVNTGTFEKTVGTGTTVIGVVFEQDGTVTAHTGHFSFGAGEVQQAPQGTWEGSVGSAGYVLAAWDGSSEDSSYLPGVTMSLLQGSRFSWAQESSETRALEGPAGSLRNAGTFYSEGEVKVRLSFTSSYSGDLHLYAVDWDTTARRESITVEDGSGSRTVPLDNNFHEGAWVSLPISVAAAGTVTITADRLAGSNAVLSGIFLGDEGTPPGPTVASEPQGDWSGTVGSAGYLLPDWDGSQDVSNMPGVTPDLVQGSRYRWEPETSDARALEGPEGSSLRNASTFYDSNQVKLQLGFGKAYTGDLHLYAVDWNTTERRELITVDGQTAALSSNFHNGAWISFPISVAAAGTVTITVDRLAGSNAVLSGIFLGDSGAPPTMPVVSAPKGNWVGAFGTEGYDLFAWNESSDLASLPEGSVNLAQGSRYRWTSSTTETQALESPAGSTRTAATLYDPNQLKLQLAFTAAYTGELSLYAVDWDNRERRELITVDGQTADLSSDFSKGAWVSFPVSVAEGGVVAITVDRLAGNNAVLSGIFLGTVTPPTNTAAPSISGTARDGQTLSASTGEWEGTEPLSYSYQWQSCNTAGGECTDIEGATEQDYTLSTFDLGMTLRVLVTAANSAGSAQATSAASAKVELAPPSELEAPSVSGTPDVHHVLYADPGIWEGTDTQLSYQWESCDSSGEECAPVEGATGSEYDLEEGDEGLTLRVRVGAGSVLGSIADISRPTPVIGAVSALASTSAPSVSGVPQSGQALSASPGGWSDTESLGYAYQWQSCDRFGAGCKDIEGATSSTYTTGTGNVGDALRVVVTASDAHHSLSESSSATQPVAAATAPEVEQLPRITGTPLRGGTLAASAGAWSGEGTIGYSYQWERCNAAGECVAITGATASSYVLTEADVNSTVRVVVEATDSKGGSIAVSSATAAIEPEALVKFSAPLISGVVQSGEVLNADPGIWSGSGQLAYSYQWKRCNAGGSECASISGASESTYTVASGDLGSTLRVDITVTNPLGSTSALSSQTVVVPGGAISVEAAQEAAQGADPALVAPSTTATLEEQTLTPALHDSGEELVSHSTLTSSSVSKEAPGEFAVNTPSGELSFTPVESLAAASTNPTIVNGAAALFANTWSATDTILRAEPLGAAAILQMRSAEAPRSYSWEARLGADQELEQLSDGSVAIVNTPEGAELPGESQEPSGPPLTEEGEPATKAEEEAAEQEEKESKEVEAKDGTETEVPLESLSASPTVSTATAESNPAELQPQNTKAEYETAKSTMSETETETAGQALMVIHAPTVTDAAGDSIPASLRVTGDTITMTISPGSGVTYPAFAQLNIAAPSDKVSAERDPVRYGLADDKPQTFEDRYEKQTEANGKQVNVFDPNLQNKAAPLHITTARLVIPYDVFFTPSSEEAHRLKSWLKEVKADGLQPYITLGPDTNEACKLKKDECFVPGLLRYRAGVKDLIHDEPGVKLWGAWNEPDNGEYPLHEHGHLAAQYWQEAQYVAEHTKNCGCKVVAGEFAFVLRYEGHYISEYKNTITEVRKYPTCKFCSHARPGIWGFHDYHDVVHDTNAFAKDFMGFTGGRPGKVQVWIGEAGVELQNGSTETELAKGTPADQEAAAKQFETLHETSTRIERVYYYGYVQPTEIERYEKDKFHLFDTGLFEAEPEGKGLESKGEARPAYCRLAFAGHSCAPVVTTSIRPGEHAPQATVVPNGLTTKLHFQYSYTSEDTEAYPYNTTSETVGSGLGPVGDAAIGAPTCDIRYRPVAENADGTSYGQPTECRLVG